jgi:uncharacterized protein (DUF302 family)
MPPLRRIFTGLLAAAAILATAQGAQAVPEGFTSIKTPHAFKTLVERVEAAVKANGMFVVTRASASKGAAGRGLAIPGNMVLGVYRNDFAVRMLEASLAAGIEAPIRFYVTENADGSANLIYRAPSAVFAPYEDGGEALATLASELDEIFAAIATQAADASGTEPVSP